MDTNKMETLLNLFRDVIQLLEDMAPRDKRKINDVEVVFMDNINGKNKHNRAYSFLEIVQAISDGGTPIGIILLRWDNPDKAESKALPNIPEHASELLAHSLAEAQDEAKSQITDDNWGI